MKTANKIIDFQEHLLNRDIDSRIKASRDDTLKIIQADIKVLDAKVDNNFELLDAKIDSNFEALNSKVDKLDESIRADIKVLDAKVDNNFEVLCAKIEVLDAKVDNLAEVIKSDNKRLVDKINDAVSSRKWIVGMFVTILLAIAALAATFIAFLG